jgi:hypothetical protein
MTSASSKTARLIAVCCAVSWLWCGCASAPSGPATAPTRDATAALIAHREFEAAARAAPQWVSDAMSTITRLEAELRK